MSHTIFLTPPSVQQRVLATAILLLSLLLLGSPASHAKASTSLRYSPPLLTNPTTITLGTGYTSTYLESGKDYIIKLSATKKIGATRISGGRNIVIQGGHITIPSSANGKGGVHQRALQIDKATGTVHIEGVLIDGSGGGESDAIVISSPLAIVQVVNVRVEGLRGKNSTWHADLIQPWGGVKELRVDHFTGSTYYQGFQLYTSNTTPKPKIGSVKISNTNLSSLGPQTSDTGGQLLWIIQKEFGCKNAFPLTLDSVYLNHRSEKSMGNTVYPGPSVKGCEARITTNPVTVTWPTLPVTGVAREGVPLKDFVPAGVVGLGYVSPSATPPADPKPAPTAPTKPVPVVTEPVKPVTEPVIPVVPATPTTQPATPVIPTLTFQAAPGKVAYGGLVTFSWSSANATSCVGNTSVGDTGFRGTKALSGTQTIQNITVAANYNITCTGPGGKIQKSLYLRMAPIATTTQSAAVGETDVSFFQFLKQFFLAIFNW